jgi:RNA polymerase sigma-70 factor (ECF subfamily)
MEDLQLTKLATASRRGDRNSFRTLVENLSRSLIAMAYRYTQNWEAARDLCQETWIRIYERISEYDPAQPFRPWLLAVHRNGCLSYLRRAAVQREVSTDQEGLRGLSVVAANPGPFEELEQQEFGARLRRAVPLLSPQQQLVFTRVDLEQGDQKEVARELGMNFTTLRTTLHFARQRLAGLLQGGEDAG